MRGVGALRRKAHEIDEAKKAEAEAKAEDAGAEGEAQSRGRGNEQRHERDLKDAYAHSEGDVDRLQPYVKGHATQLEHVGRKPYEHSHCAGEAEDQHAQLGEAW